MIQRYTGSYSTKRIIYYLDRIDKFINLDFRPYSNRKLALRLKHVTKSLTACFSPSGRRSGHRIWLRKEDPKFQIQTDILEFETLFISVSSYSPPLLQLRGHLVFL